MAVSISQDCPHCDTKKAGFSLRGHGRHAPSRSGVVFFMCNHCNHGLCVAFKGDSLDFLNRLDSGDFFDLARQNHIGIQSIYPQKRKSSAPDHVSENVARAFIQAQEASTRDHRDASAAMFRKAIDIATRELDPGLAGKILAARIDALHSAGKLTDDLKEWAHLIRLDGNQGAHDDVELKQDELEQLASFTELFLTYTMTLPVRVKARKAAAADAATP